MIFFIYTINQYVKIMSNIIKQSVRVSKSQNGTYQIDQNGSINAVQYIYDSGFEELAVAVNMIISFENKFVKTQIVELWRQDNNKSFQLYLNPTGRFINNEMVTDTNLYINTVTNTYISYHEATVEDTTQEILDPYNESYTPKRYKRKLKMNCYNAWEYRDRTLGFIIRQSLMSEMIKK